jgi:hypothetical protein
MRRETAEQHPAQAPEAAFEVEPEPVETLSADAVEPTPPEAVEEELREGESVAAADEPPDDPGEGLPLHKWVHTATQMEESAAADWPHALLSNRRSPKSD